MATSNSLFAVIGTCLLIGPCGCLDASILAREQGAERSVFTPVEDLVLREYIQMVGQLCDCYFTMTSRCLNARSASGNRVVPRGS
jgi:hypothetical protein